MSATTREPASGSGPSGGLVMGFTVRRPHLDIRLDATVEAGATVAIVGPNGAGKSTCLAAIAGLVAIDDGSILLGGRDLADASSGRHLPPDERGLGVVPQQRWLFPHLSVLDNVAFGVRASGVSRSDARRAAGEWLERLALVALGDRRPWELSGGQQQLVALARALARSPQALLLDEPLAALDVATRAEVRATLVHHLHEFEGPTVVVTHDPSDATLLADHVVVLEGGRVTQSGSPEALRSSPRTPYVADLVGINLLVGHARSGSVALDGAADGTRIELADATASGPVTVSFSPTAVSIYLDRPDGSPRNTWQATVAQVEASGGRCRISFEAPIRVSADVTLSAAREMELDRGRSVWLSVKATEVHLNPRQ